MKLNTAKHRNPATPPSLQWQQPYSFKQKRFWLFFYRFEILFEGGVVYRIIGGFQYYDEARRITTMLNAAWNLGYHSAQMSARGKDSGW